MTLKTFNLPDVGEGLTEAEIVQWKVAPGATVAVNDIICEIETAKSLVELSSPYAGTVSELLVAEGETIEVGTPIFAVDDAAAQDGNGSDPGPSAATDIASDRGDRADRAADPAAAGAAGAAADGSVAPTGDAPVPAPEMPGELAGGRQDGVDATGPGAAEPEPSPGPLVGTGPKADAVKRRPRRTPSAEPWPCLPPWSWPAGHARRARSPCPGSRPAPRGPRVPRPPPGRATRPRMQCAW